jgi:SAM-dependent methyltransferase
MIDPNIYEQKWYYSVELEPGRFTKGFNFKNIAPARRCLDAVNVKGHSLVDLSTMEGMFATLLAKRGGSVTATDTIDSSARVDLLKAAHHVTFKYIPHMPLDDQAAFLFKYQTSTSYSPLKPLKASMLSPYGFDIVLSSGVMYHVLSPLHYIMQLRRLVKLGGLVILETACAINDEIEMHHDFRQNSFVYGGSCSWFASTGAIDLFFRACFLQPLGFTYVRSQTKSDLDIIRLGLVARAVQERPFEPALFSRLEKGEIVRSYDYKPLYESAQLTGSVASEVQYRDDLLHPVGPHLSSSLFSQYPEVPYAPDYLRLALEDR